MQNTELLPLTDCHMLARHQLSLARRNAVLYPKVFGIVGLENIRFWESVVSHLEPTQPTNAPTEKRLAWIELTRENLPSGRVLAGCFKAGDERKDMMVGFVVFDKLDKSFYVYFNDEALHDVTHFLNLSEIAL